MDTRNWQAVKELFERSLALPPGEREAFVLRGGADRPTVADEVLQLLALDRRDDVTCEPPSWTVDGSPDARALPRLRGPYRLEGVLGRGGMGTVYLGRRSDAAFERLVAIKVLRRGMDTEDVLRRFRLERQVLAGLQHPNITQLHDGGTTEDGLPYLVMELVEGRPLDRFCRENELDLRARVRLFLDVCAAVQHAHETGVVHRDLKPSNVLVTAEGRPKLVDFGIAKLVDGSGVASTLELTTTERRLMTPAYASPEQVRGERASIATDVYALGVLLYELITGTRPYELTVSSPQEIARVVCEEEPPRPRIAARRSGNAPAGRLTRDLETICLTALRKEPERRYGTVAALRDDLLRWLEGRPVEARADTRWYRISRFVRRHRSLAAGTAAVFLALVAGLVAEGIRRRESEANAREAREQRDKVLRLSAFVQLEDLDREADELWPPRPERLPAFDDWLARAEALIAGLDPRPGDPGHRARLAELRASGRFEDGAWRFASEDERWWHAQLAKLVASIEALEDPASGLLAGLPPRRGWGVKRRRDWVTEVQLRPDEAVQRAWDAALRSIADPAECPAYGGLSIEPQVDLVPLRRSPASGLWEFLHLPTGDPPGPDGAVSEATGIVFVLLPGGVFRMGSTDELGYPDEKPIHAVELAPFFLARHELTQGQWLRLEGVNPSFFSPSYDNRAARFTLAHPVESLSWEESTRALARWGLLLPSEAQWEYAARGGTESAWWTGATRESLAEVGAANLLDATAARSHVDWADRFDWPGFDDGWFGHAPVDALAANPFGLHHVAGNVSEWCRDHYAPDFYERGQRVDPVCLDPDSPDRVHRGGSFDRSARSARSAARFNELANYRDFQLGLRAARALEGELRR